jgi:hypothetical protein
MVYLIGVRVVNGDIGEMYLNLATLAISLVYDFFG